MCNRAGQFDMAHAFTTHLGKGNFNAAFFTNHTAVLEALVLATQTFVILDRPENLGAEQAIAFRFKGTVVNGFRFFYFTK